MISMRFLISTVEKILDCLNLGNVKKLSGAQNKSTSILQKIP